MFNKEKAVKLLVELKEEAKNLPEINAFGDDNHKEQYPFVFKYLETGIVPKYIDDDHELLYSVVHDFDDVCNDYGI